MLTLKEKIKVVESYLEEFDLSHVCEEGEFTHNGTIYYLSEYFNPEIIDDGKYQYGEKIFCVGEALQEDYEPFYVSQTFIRTGSYYSEFYYEYDKFKIVKPVEVVKVDWYVVEEGDC